LHADALIAGLRKADYDLVGDLDELLPRVVAEPGSQPADQPAEQVLEAAVESAAALIVNQYRKAYPAAQPQAGLGSRGSLAARVESTVAASPRLKRTVRELSSRHASVRQLRIMAWRALERSRTRKHS
jgi:hypothetical protein